MDKILWNFEIQKKTTKPWPEDQTSRKDHGKKMCYRFCNSRGPQSENKGKQIYRKIQGSFPRAKSDVESEVEWDTRCSLYSWKFPLESTWKGTGMIKDLMRDRYHPDHGNVKNQLDYLEVPWRPGEICCYTGFCGKPPLVWKTSKQLNNEVYKCINEIKFGINVGKNENTFHAIL